MSYRVRLEVIKADLLDIDPAVQFEWTLQEKRWRAIGANWDQAFAGVLEATPCDNGASERYWVFDGRHRLLGGRDVAGVAEFRCDVHHPALPPEERARRKRALDRDRRAVKPIESFLVGVVMEDPETLEIKKIVEDAGFKVYKTSGSTRSAGLTSTPTHIEAVGILTKAYRDNLLSRVMALNTLWVGETKTNSDAWLAALYNFCSLGYDQDLTPAQYQKLRDQIPALIWRKAVADSSTVFQGGARGIGEVPKRIAEYLRKAARIRPQKP